MPTLITEQTIVSGNDEYELVELDEDPSTIGQLYKCEELGSTTTSSVINVLKFNLFNNSVPAGDYWLRWSFSLSSDTGDTKAHYKVTEDTRTVETTIQLGSTSGDDANQEYIISGCDKVTRTEGQHLDLNFYFRCDQSGETLTINYRHGEVWRIG